MSSAFICLSVEGLQVIQQELGLTMLVIHSIDGADIHIELPRQISCELTIVFPPHDLSDRGD